MWIIVSLCTERRNLLRQIFCDFCWILDKKVQAVLYHISNSIKLCFFNVPLIIQKSTKSHQLSKMNIIQNFKEVSTPLWKGFHRFVACPTCPKNYFFLAMRVFSKWLKIYFSLMLLASACRNWVFTKSTYQFRNSLCPTVLNKTKFSTKL